MQNSQARGIFIFLLTSVLSIVLAGAVWDLSSVEPASAFLDGPRAVDRYAGRAAGSGIFADVPTPGKEWMQPWIEAFYSAGITSGCAAGPLRYCPEQEVTRAEMAVFIERAVHYPNLPHTPPAQSGTFADVPVPGKEWMEPWIEEFYDAGITSGCAANPLRYCPERGVTRAEMAVFLLRAKHGPSYTPPASTGVFSDVPVTGKEWMQPWIEQFYQEGITTGCAAAPLRYCPEQAVTRAEMAVFILRTFTSIPGPVLTGCPTSSTNQFSAIPVDGPPADHPDSLHADLNLSLRGYEPTTAPLSLVSYNGSPDPNAPQMPGLFADSRVPTFTSAYRVYDWDWSCGGQPHGCRGSLLTYWPVTLLGMGTTAGETIRIPSRAPDNYAGGFKAMVLYAEETRITFVYMRQDSVAFGYSVHIENVCVDPNLLSLYRSLNSAGRGELPGLHESEPLGTAQGSAILVAVRDTGTFMDPRSRRDWWQGR